MSRYCTDPVHRYRTDPVYRAKIRLAVGTAIVIALFFIAGSAMAGVGGPWV